MAEVTESELVVIGAGPGGYAAAFLAADRGLQTTLIDPGAKPGGVCLHVGCIPSKALLHAAHLITDTREGEGWGIHFAPPRIDVAALRARKEKVVDTLSSHLARSCKDRKVTYLQTRARFEGPDALTLESGGSLRFKHCIVATGSSPTRLPQLSVDSPRLLDSTGALQLEDIPKTLLVVGGGYIGLEMGTVYAALGTRVTVVELTDSLLPGVDPDLVRPLANRLKAQFERILLSTKVASLREAPNGLRAALEGEGVSEPEVVFDKVLVAVGRKPNSRDLGLEKAGIEVDEKGFVRVDERRRTTNERVYAIGDVAGEPMLAHKAAHEGKVAVEVITGEPAVWEPRAIPAVVFTDPEIAWCGLTETEARQQEREVKVARFHWGASGRATTLGRSDGLTKLLVDPDSDRLLGVGLVGPGAGELIAEGVLAIEMAATARDLALTIHPHPTLTETIMEAAESLHGLATHLYKVRKS
ncbi:MAG: dihydrolipoyl dehydrogenase [Gemmataceae bacterium]|nr:dihydrolipoyl dehydrogenase [Gemmataceae bacterium]